MAVLIMVISVCDGRFRNLLHLPISLGLAKWTKHYLDIRLTNMNLVWITIVRGFLSTAMDYAIFREQITWRTTNIEC